MKRPNEIEALTREIQRLQDTKRRALSLADERAKEGNELRLENERLRARLEECHRS
jgi:regulator of replication initiation timing